jgi:aarF domain-containing kinase
LIQRLLTDSSPRLREALRYTIYGKTGVFDVERFIDVMEAFETFVDAAKSGGGEDLQGSMATLGIVDARSPRLLPLPLGMQQEKQGKTRTALGFLLSEQGEFFREFILDEVCSGTFLFFDKF